MLKLNDTCNAPLRFVADDGTIIGQFYNSWDNQYHLAIYQPYKYHPTKYLCEDIGNFVSSRAEGKQRGGQCCPDCSKKLKNLSQVDDEKFSEFGFV